MALMLVINRHDRKRRTCTRLFADLARNLAADVQHDRQRVPAQGLTDDEHIVYTHLARKNFAAIAKEELQQPPDGAPMPAADAGPVQDFPAKLAALRHMYPAAYRVIQNMTAEFLKREQHRRGYTDGDGQ